MAAGKDAVPRRPSRRGRPPAGAGSDARGVLLAAAIEVFGAKGYAAASMADILVAAGLSAATLYHHFGDKAGLYIAAADRGYSLVLEEVERQTRPSDNGAQRLQAVLSAGTALVATRPGVLSLVVAAPTESRRRPTLRPATDGLRRFTAHIRAAALLGVDDHSLNPAMDADTHAEVFATLIIGLSSVTTSMRLEEHDRRSATISRIYDSGGPLGAVPSSLGADPP